MRRAVALLVALLVGLPLWPRQLYPPLPVTYSVHFDELQATAGPQAGGGPGALLDPVARTVTGVTIATIGATLITIGILGISGAVDLRFGVVGSSATVGGNPRISVSQTSEVSSDQVGSGIALLIIGALLGTSGLLLLFIEPPFNE